MHAAVLKQFLNHKASLPGQSSSTILAKSKDEVFQRWFYTINNSTLINFYDNGLFLLTIVDLTFPCYSQTEGCKATEIRNKQS